MSDSKNSLKTISNNPEHAARLMAASLNVGESLNAQECPNCGGGLRNDKSFSITRTDETTLKFICFRAKCGWKGSINSTHVTTHDGGYNPHQRNLTTTAGRRLPVTYRRLRRTQRANLLARFPAISYLHDVGWDRKRDRIVFPIRNFFNEIVGEVARYYPWLAKQQHTGYMPKSLVAIYKDGANKIDFTCAMDQTPRVYLVEDAVSARCIKNVTGVDTISLNGTRIDKNTLQDIKFGGKYKEIVIALDKDAWVNALAIEKKYRLLDVKVIQWESGLDPKDMTPDEVHEVFGMSNGK